MSEPILDRALTSDEIEACFWCRKTHDEVRAAGGILYTNGALAKLGVQVVTCPEHSTILAGTSGKILVAFYRLLEAQMPGFSGFNDRIGETTRGEASVQLLMTALDSAINQMGGFVLIADADMQTPLPLLVMEGCDLGMKIRHATPEEKVLLGANGTRRGIAIATGKTSVTAIERMHRIASEAEKEMEP